MQLFITDTLMRIAGTNRLRCLTCCFEFEDDAACHVAHRHFHRRMLEIHRRRGLPIWPFSRANLERTFTVSPAGVPPSTKGRAILARNALTARYYESVYSLLLGSALPVDEIISFKEYAAHAVDAEPDWADIRNGIMDLVEEHEFTVKHERRDRARLRTGGNGDGVPLPCGTTARSRRKSTAPGRSAR